MVRGSGQGFKGQDLTFHTQALALSAYAPSQGLREALQSLPAVQSGTSHHALIVSSCMRFTTFWA